MILKKLVIQLLYGFTKTRFVYTFLSLVVIGPVGVLWDKLAKNRKIQFLLFALKEKEFSVSQIGQDMWVLFVSKGKRDGYFVDIGACHPQKINNTYLLETKYGWNGILVEPNPALAKEILSTRASKLFQVLVTNDDNSEYLISSNPEFNTTSNQLKKFRHKGFDLVDAKNIIPTLTINELLEMSRTPSSFDLLSIDVEGGELSLIQTLDFDRWKPKMIVVEHNFKRDRKRIHKVLKAKGYILDDLTPVWSWDDWYLLKEPKNAESNE